MLKNKTLLITGGTGSFGNTVLKHFLDKNLKEIRILSRDEKKQNDMRTYFKNEKIKFFIGDVRDSDSLEIPFKGTDFVFHAAALKQVPSCEFFPIEATKTNVLGTQNVIRASIKHNIQKIVCLSTDKAAYPINTMGITKALMEKVVIAESRFIGQNEGPKICITRYGNVMASRGSVIPLFIKQILENKPITITNPEMTRFLMSLDEAVDLVLYAFENGDQGDLFIQKSPSSNIKDLALALLKMFNATNELKIIGSRHAEKIYETLLTKEEYSKAIDLGKYYKVKSDSRDLNYSNNIDIDDKQLPNNKEYNSHNTDILNVDQIIEKLYSLDYVNEISNLK